MKTVVTAFMNNPQFSNRCAEIRWGHSIWRIDIRYTSKHPDYSLFLNNLDGGDICIQHISTD